MTEEFTESLSQEAEEFTKSLSQDPDRWPILSRASKDLRTALATKIEWLVEDGFGKCKCCGELTMRNCHVDHNYTQIFRFRFSKAIMSEGEAYKEMLDSIEKALQRGVRGNPSAHPSASLAGGVYDLLGRWPRKNDQLALYFVRYPRLFHDDYSGDWKWICEVSLLATKGS